MQKYILPCHSGYHSMHLTVISKNFWSFGVNKESLIVLRECKYSEQRERANNEMSRQAYCCVGYLCQFSLALAEQRRGEGLVVKLAIHVKIIWWYKKFWSMFFTYWNDGKFNISSFKSAVLLAGFLHQQFCFLRQKISFFHFDCKQIGGCPLIHPRLCVHANRRWCGINNKSRNSRKTNKKKPSWHILAIITHDWALPDFSVRSKSYMRSSRLFRK